MRFDYEDVEQYCVKIEASVKRLDAIIDNYKSIVKPVTSGSIWDGDASNGFKEKINKTLNVLLAMEKSLQNSVVYIRDCSVKFETLEKSILEALDKIL